MDNRLFTFIGGDLGSWKVTSVAAVAGGPWPHAARLDILPGTAVPPAAAWTLRGMISNERYVTREEKTALVARQEGLGRPAARCGALIPIRKTPAWWALTQDERRAVFEDRSDHIRTGMRYLPAIARRLHHCRDLGEPQPFDFLTWFEFAPEDATAFDDLLAALRATPEWKFVDWEVEVRVARED